MRRCFPGTDNPNSFLIFEIGISVNNEQYHQPLDHPDRMPTLLVIFKPVRHNQMKRILEDIFGEIERNTMLGTVALGLLGIPFKSQYGGTVIYKIVRTIL